MSESPQPKKKTPGELLKDVRTSRNITLKDVHIATKIPLDVLQAIEEGYTVRTLSPFYFKGFMKMYAQYLGINTDSVVHAEPIPEEAPLQEPVIVKESPKKDLGKVWSSEIKSLISRRRQKRMIQILGAFLVLFCIYKMSGCVRKYVESRPPKVKKQTQLTSTKTLPHPEPKKQVDEAIKPEKSKEVVEPKVEPKAKPKAESQKAEVKTAPVAVQPQPKIIAKTEPPPTEKTSKEFQLTVSAQKNGWLQVKVDGNLVFQSTMKKGMTETWKANDSVEISGKSIHYLSYKLDGKDLAGLSDKNQTARRVVITKGGLSVKQ